MLRYSARIETGDREELMDWFAIFKTGKHIDSQGRPFEATHETLDTIVTMNAGREVPIAVGHPKTDSPAWGWVNGYKRVGDVLYAKVKELVPQFEAWLNEKRYKERSVALNQDMTLRHIGFLGAVPPAVEGLPGIALAAAGDDTVLAFAANDLALEFSSGDDAHLNPDGTFKGGFDGCVAHFRTTKGLNEDHARALCAHIGRQAGKIMSAQELDALILQFTKKEETHMKKLLALLGLTETATEDDAIGAVNAIRASAGTIVANKAVLGALELTPEATEAEAVALINTFKKGHSDAVTLRTDNARLEKEIADNKAEDAVHFARVKGKIKKEQEPWALDYAKKDLAGFQEFVNKAAVVDEDLADKGHAFAAPGSDVNLDSVQDISSRALEFKAQAEKRGQVITISEAVHAVTRKKR
jgi:hypothetical protein